VKLTPFFGFLFLLVGLACTRSSAGPVPSSAVTPPAVVPDSVHPVQMPRRLQWSPRSYQLRITVQTLQRDSAAGDSADRQTILHRLPEASVLGAWLRFESTADTTAYLRVRVDSSTGFQIATDTSCITRPPELTPILLKQLLIPEEASSLMSGSGMTDTLEYRSCLQGISASSTVIFRWNHIQSQPDSLRIQVRYSGTTRADSSRFLPMHLEATLTGESTLLLYGFPLEVQRLDSELQSVIRAHSTQRSQEFEQRVRYQLWSR
jgi:hypothetical protein